MDSQSRVCVAGSNPLIGTAIARQLSRLGHELVAAAGWVPDWTDPHAVQEYFGVTNPDSVFLVGGKSGGIAANQKYPAELIRDNLLLECNVIHAAHRCGVKKLLYLASSCSYPRDCEQPMRVASLMTGPLEPTNEAYAMAKLAGISLCRAYHQQYGANFIVGIPADAFGPGDDFDPESSHVVAALMRRMHDAKLHNAEAVEVWGTGSPRRDFIYADDLADACIFVMQHYEEPTPLNLGGGQDLSIAELAAAIRATVGYTGEIWFDAAKPDGMPRKFLDASAVLAMGWQPKVELTVALAQTYASYLSSRWAHPTPVNAARQPIGVR